VLFEEASRSEEKLVRGADLELHAEAEKHKLA
jgi:hypothetical protein